MSIVRGKGKPYGYARKAARSKIFTSTIIVSTLLLFLASYPSVFAQPVNGGFETGDLTGWTTQGNVEVLQASNFAPSITPPAGSHFALLSTGPDDSPAPDDGDLDGDGIDDNDITIMSQAFTSGAGTLSFEWSWLTDEEDEGPLYDDFFMVRLDGNIILSGSVDKIPTQSPFPNIPTDDESYSVTSPGPTSGSDFDDGRSEFQTFTTPITAGTHTIEFIVADAGNHNVDSGLLVDAFEAPAPPAPAPSYTVPVGGTLMPVNKLAILTPYLALAGLVGAVTTAFVYRRRRKAST